MLNKNTDRGRERDGERDSDRRRLIKTEIEEIEGKREKRRKKGKEEARGGRVKRKTD